jgi:hypothetical protein
MLYILVPVLVILMAMVVISLFRGLNAFRKSLDQDKDREVGSGATEMQLLQNRMMWARIKYQAIAIVVVMVLLVASRH